MRSRNIALAVATVVLALPVAPATAKDTTMQIRDDFYRKPFVIIAEGETVTWRNMGGEGHTVVAYEGQFDSSPGTDADCTPLLRTADCIQPRAQWSQTFEVAGTYDYFCKVQGHADPNVRPDPSIRDGRDQPCGMCGQIVVVVDEEPPAPTRQAEPPRETPRSPSPSPSPTDGADPEPSPDPSDLPDVAAGPGQTSSGGGPPIGLALVGIVILSGAGWLVWRTYIAV